MVPLTSSTFWGTKPNARRSSPSGHARTSRPNTSTEPRATSYRRGKKAHQRRLAGARTADHAERAAAWNLERHVVHRVLRTARIGKRDAGKSDRRDARIKASGEHIARRANWGPSRKQGPPRQQLPPCTPIRYRPRQPARRHRTCSAHTRALPRYARRSRSPW